MDIAKIRKKLKDTEDKGPSGEVNPSGVDKSTSDVQPESGPQDTSRQPAITDAADDTSHAEGSPAVELESQQDDRRHEEDEAGWADAAGSSVAEEPEVPAVKPSPAVSEVTVQDDRRSASVAGTEPQFKEKKADEGGDGVGKEDEVLEILTFGLLGEEFAFKISQLKEILKYQRITEVPRMPRYVLGITSLRGKVIPVVDLRVKILSHESAAGVSDKTKILILKGPKGVIGALVDKVSGVMRIAKSEILPPPTHLSEEQLRFVEGVAVLDKRFVSIVNMEEATAIHFE